MHRQKRCEYNNKDEINRPNTLNNKNYQEKKNAFKSIIQNICGYTKLKMTEQDLYFVW